MLFLFCFHPLPFSKIIMWFFNSGTASTNGVWRSENTGKAFPGVLKLLFDNADLAQFVVMRNIASLTLFSTWGSRPGRPSQVPIRTTDIRGNRLSPLFPNPDSSVSGHLTISPWWVLLKLVISGLIIL